MNDDYNKLIREQALYFHKKKPVGKIQVQPSKKITTEEDLALAYSPGVAFPCLEISKAPSSVFDYTSRGNLVAVITDGSAVLGLGNIGPLASKPVMEGKSVLFKHFAGIDVFDLELRVKNQEEFIQACRALEPSVGGINLEDISAPHCFEIEKRLEEELSIPVFHDDQHGTAIIVSAALMNACTITKKKLNQIKIVFNGAGAAAIACARLIQEIGVKKENIMMCDSKGVIQKERKNLNVYKQEFALQTPHRTLKDAIQNADAFIGLSIKDSLTAQMVQSMSNQPIIFALANPNPEIQPHVALEAAPSAIMATGRVDFPNQVNNVLGFPSIFRAALDVRATHINKEMKIAAVKALAELAQEDVPESVFLAYGGERFSFGSNYILPKPFDPRVLKKVTCAVAKAAIKSGVAQNPISDFNQYQLQLDALHGAKKIFFQHINKRVKASKKKPTIVFPEGDSPRILQAINSTIQDDLYHPIILGDKNKILKQIQHMNLTHLKNTQIQNPVNHSQKESFIKELSQKKNISSKEAEKLLEDNNYFGAMYMETNQAHGLITGATQNYVESIRPILKVIGTQNKKNKLACGMNIILCDDNIFIFADTTININPTAQQISQIAEHAMELARWIHLEPRIALLGFSNFISLQENPLKMKESCQILQKKYPQIPIDGEMQADTAVNPSIIQRLFPKSPLQEGANILIFPNLDSANIAYKLVQQFGRGEVIGPLLMGVRKPVDIVQLTGTAEDVAHIILFNLLKIQTTKKE